jgi:hypothetical protein
LVIGANDLVPVLRDGANIPPKYRPLLDAFGLSSNNCTVTHVGAGLVVTAGHCFDAPDHRIDDMPCSDTTVAWGVRADKPSYLTSSCVSVLAAEHSDDRDYAIFRVTPIPPVNVTADLTERPEAGRTITVFGHPSLRPLEWSQECTVQPSSSGHFGADQFAHQCDTEPGSSGSSILDDEQLTVVGIHDGGVFPWNYATYLAATPLAELVHPTGAGHRWYATATPVVPLGAGSPACTTLTVAHPGNAASVRIDLDGYHPYRFDLRATLAHGSRTVDVFAVGSFPRGAGVYSLRGQPLQGFAGDAAGDWTLCVLDTGASNVRTGTLDTWSVHD